MQLDPEASYFMPVSIPQRPLKAGVFDNVFMIRVSCLSTTEALRGLLPEPFQPAEKPVVSVYYAQCPKVNFLAGAGYNMIGVDLATVFHGKQDVLEGDFSLVLWENQMNPVLRGREILGVPKLLADVPDPQPSSERWQVHAAENGHVLMEMNATATPSDDTLLPQQLKAQLENHHWMGWRYIPNMNGVGAALSQPTLIGRELQVHEAEKVEGQIRFGDVTWETNPASADIVAALKTLEIKEYLDATVTRGTMTITRAKNRVLQ